MKHVIIIAEAGVNHNGDVEMAKRMVKAAAKAGVDYVKFQTFKASSLVAANAQKAEYQQRNCPGMGDTQMDMLKALELRSEDFVELEAECERCGVGFLSSPFDVESVQLLAGVGMDHWKIPSGEITNLPYLRAIGSMGGKVILSTGMSTLAEVKWAVDVLEQAGTPRENITLLHCNTQYPTPMEDVNLLAMQELAGIGCASVGYSDHTLGITVPVAAVALGAKVIEKHFTLDKTLPGPDHKASLEPDELKKMVDAIRDVEKALGSPHKRVSISETANIGVARKSIVASQPIKAGEKFSEHNITVKRPGTGISPMLWDEVVGLEAKRDFKPDELIEL
jgi:N-acetylneuraminate synthase